MIVSENRVPRFGIMASVHPQDDLAEDVAAFHAFQENIADRCDEPPQVMSLREIGSYRVFGG